MTKSLGSYPTALERILFRDDPFDAHLRENGTTLDDPPSIFQQIKELQRQLVRAQLHVVKLQEALSRDQTRLSYALDHIVRVLRGYQWILDGEWGAYSYEDQTAEVMRKEAAMALQTLREIAVEALRTSGVLISEALNPPQKGQLPLPFRMFGQ